MAAKEQQRNAGRLTCPGSSPCRCRSWSARTCSPLSGSGPALTTGRRACPAAAEQRGVLVGGCHGLATLGGCSCGSRSGSGGGGSGGSGSGSRRRQQEAGRLTGGVWLMKVAIWLDRFQCPAKHPALPGQVIGQVLLSAASDEQSHVPPAKQPRAVPALLARAALALKRWAAWLQGSAHAGWAGTCCSFRGVSLGQGREVRG